MTTETGDSKAQQRAFYRNLEEFCLEKLLKKLYSKENIEIMIEEILVAK